MLLVAEGIEAAKAGTFGCSRFCVVTFYAKILGKLMLILA